MSEDRDGLPFSNTEPEVPASTWADSQPMTLADLNAAYERLRDSPPTWRERPVVLVSPQEARAIESTLREMDARINGSPEPQTSAAIESTFAVLNPARYAAGMSDAVRAALRDRENEIMGSPVLALPVDARIELLEPTRYPLPSEWHPDEGERYAAGFWLPYRASDADARQHVKDFYATRIDDTRGANSAQDVMRWNNDPARRDELTRRAREYAECVQMLVGR